MAKTTTHGGGNKIRNDFDRNEEQTMNVGKLLKTYTPPSIKNIYYHLIGAAASKTRKESNAWLNSHASDIEGHVLSIGSGDDKDGQGRYYRDYFKNASSYITSEVTSGLKCDMVIDVRSMPEIQSKSLECVFCSGVLEHVDNYLAALAEITRILKPGGILLLGLPFRQGIHLAPYDYWRFTEHGIRHLLKDDYEIIDLAAMDKSVTDFPAAYWVKAKKQKGPQ